MPDQQGARPTKQSDIRSLNSSIKQYSDGQKLTALFEAIAVPVQSAKQNWIRSGIVKSVPPFFVFWSGVSDKAGFECVIFELGAEPFEVVFSLFRTKIDFAEVLVQVVVGTLDTFVSKIGKEDVQS